MFFKIKYFKTKYSVAVKFQIGRSLICFHRISIGSGGAKYKQIPHNLCKHHTCIFIYAPMWKFKQHMSKECKAWMIANKHHVMFSLYYSHLSNKSLSSRGNHYHPSNNRPLVRGIWLCWLYVCTISIFLKELESVIMF